MQAKKAKINRQQLIQLILSRKDSKDDIQDLVDLLVEKQISLNINKVTEEKLTLGDRASDRLTKIAGSWRFIFFFLGFMFVWVVINVMMLFGEVDPYPFILLNLMLSCVAALQAPIIMMSQNRQEDKDRIRGENNYKVDLKSELLLEDLHKKMDHIIYSQKIIKEKLNIIESDVESDDDLVELG